MKAAWLFAACLVLAAVTTPGTAASTGVDASNEAPLVDAGLDQTVTRGTTVYLDAGGSRDPDGAIERYDWTVAAESGDATNATTPACRNCEQTQFRAEATGTYRVTLAVTDDDGATTTDTLYVTVEPGDPPTASLAAPTETTTGDPARFTVDADAGSAPLDRLVWSVDGERVATESVSGDAATTTRTVRFPTTGPHTVSVAVVDEDSQRDTAERSITITDPTDGDTTTGGSNADVDGPQVVTGHGELTAEYHLTNGASGVWMQDGRQVARGTSTTRSFGPGVHELYAATDAGAATFSDGTRTVVADPAPELSAVQTGNNSVVPVTIDATDDYGNLHTVSIAVDGERVETLTTDDLGGRAEGDGLATTTYLPSLEPGNHTITVRARDTRDQTDVAVRYVEVPGPPEVVSAGFVQDGPLDQYHPRIDESRYMATYRVKVDLNGVDPERIGSSIQIADTGWSSELDSSIEDGDTLLLEKSAYRERAADIRAISDVTWRVDDYTNTTSNSIPVTFAPPEIRLETVDPQTNYDRGRGIVFDARDSFDPDGAPVHYRWTGVKGGTTEQSRVTLYPNSVGILNVTDKQHQSSSTAGLLSWFTPELTDVEIQDEGPFYPNETVTVSVNSERYYLSKPTYENATSFSVRPERGRVTNHTLFVEEPGEVADEDPEGVGRSHRWTVEIPAKEFRDGSLNVSSYPTEHPHMQYRMTIPQPELYVATYSDLKDVSTTVEYLVERPQYVTQRTSNEDVRDDLLGSGYEVRRVDEAGREFHLEKYVQTSPAEYDVDTMRFYERGRRQLFLESNPEWTVDGTTTETQRWTTTETEWRSTRSGSGTFTGNTRREKVRDGEYRTEKKYSYQTTEYYETTVSYEDTYTTTETKVSSKEKCGMFGCRKYQTRVTETETHTVTRTKEVTRSRTVEKTYWSTRPRHSSHDYTGDVRRVTVREPEYERQYEFEVENQHSKTRQAYLVEKRTLLEPASYEWQSWKTMYSRLRAESTAGSADVQIAEIAPSKQWTLRKQTGTERTRTSHRRGDEPVLKTIGQADVTVVQYYARNDTKRLPEMPSRETHYVVEYTEQGLIDADEMEDILTKKSEEKYGE